jgi:DNA-binding LacI/PurR family transcriptional regulator
MSDVAAAAGVSRALVSIVFREAPGASEDTRGRVREAATRIGYRPNTTARQLAQGAPSTIGILMTLRNPYQADLADNLYTEAQAVGFDLVLATVGRGRDAAAGIVTLAGHPCAGYILLGPACPPERVAELDRVSPVVVIGERANEGVVDVVRSNDEAGVRLALDHLHALGHRRIAHVASPHGASMKDRAEAYRAWMAQRAPGEAADVVMSEETEAGGLEAAAVLSGRAVLPTAVLAAMDRCAMGLVRGFAAAGVEVPDRVSVAGFDDMDSTQFGGIALTTVHQDTGLLARIAMDYLRDRIEGLEAPPRLTVLAPSLRVRATTGPAPEALAAPPSQDAPPRRRGSAHDSPRP